MSQMRFTRGARRAALPAARAALGLLLIGGAGCVGDPDLPLDDEESLEGEEMVGEAEQEYVATGQKWASKSYSIKANLTSFQNSLGTLNLNSGQAEFWITYALSNWKERTGADLSLSYGGTTTTGCIVGNGENGVAAQTACLEPGCWTWAQTVWWYNGGDMVEADVCVYGGSATWRVDSASFPAGNKDLVGVLAHEFGHALGLHHSGSTIMDSPTFDLGNTLARYPYGDDAAGMRALYGTKTRDLRWQSWNGSSWSGTTVLTGGMQMHANGAIGVNSAGSQVMVAAHLDPGAGVLHFTRSAIPLSASSVWDNRFVVTNSYRPPAVAARSTGTPLWVAAWSSASTTAASCGGMGVLSSGDVFDSGWWINLGDCSLHEPALVHDPISNRFVMLYAALASGANEANNGRIYARTSTDGVSWTPAQDLGIYTIDAPRAACAVNGQCMLSYVGNGADPWLYTTQFTVSGAGSVSLGSSSWNYNYVQRTPPVAASRQWVYTTYWDLQPLFMTGLQWTGSASDRANGVGGIWTSTSSTSPIPSFGWVGMGQWLDHRADLVGSQSTTYPIYALTTAM